MKSTGQIIGESDLEYRRYLQNLVKGQVKFIQSLEETATRLPHMAQQLSEVIADNRLTLEEYQVRLRGELNRALSSKKN